MNLWIELHCEGESRGNPGKPARAYDTKCDSFSNENPSTFVSRISDIQRLIRIEAKRRRWVRRGGKWFCPYCARRR